MIQISAKPKLKIYIIMTKHERTAVIDLINCVEEEVKNPSPKMTALKWEVNHYLKKWNVINI